MQDVDKLKENKYCTPIEFSVYNAYLILTLASVICWLISFLTRLSKNYTHPGPTNSLARCLAFSTALLDKPLAAAASYGSMEDAVLNSRCNIYLICIQTDLYSVSLTAVFLGMASHHLLAYLLIIFIELPTYRY